MNSQLSESAERQKLPAGIWALGFVSMLMDISSEMIHALLPLYMVTVLGTSTLAVGIIEGIAEATASITKVFSGALSDRLGRRKALAVAGYGLAALTKPVFPLAGSLGWLVAARFVDRIGKGIRGAPRDALVADLAPPHLVGAAFGLRQTLDTVGAFLGPLLAIGLMWFTANQFQTVFWLAVLPAFAAVAVLIVFIREPATARPPRPARLPLRRAEMARLGRQYWTVVAISAVFTLARFSEAFLLLKAAEVGLSLAMAPMVLLLMGVAFSLSAYPVGILSDRIGSIGLLLAGLALLVAADLVLAVAAGPIALAIGVVLWGLHMGFTQGLLSSLVAKSAPADLRGTAFGVFNLVSGVALLAASVTAGAAWTLFGSATTFFAGAAFTALAALALFACRHRLAA